MLRKVVLFSLIALVAVVALGASLAFAQVDAPSAEDNAAVHPRDVIDPDVIKETVAGALGMTVEELEAAHEEGLTLSELAEQQGIDLEAVQAAADAARDEMIDEALAAGAIDEEEAERLRNMPLRRHGRRSGGPLRRLLREIVDPDVVKEAVADALGMSADELEAAREGGSTLPELAEQQGIEMEAIRAAAQEATVDMIQQAVDDETITEAQGQRLLDAVERGPGGRFGGRCHDGPGGPPPGAPQEAPTGMSSQDA